MDDVKEAKFRSNYWKQTIKTNVTLDHYLYDRHYNRTFESLGRKLRDLFQVKSLEYDYDYNQKENGTDYCETDNLNKTEDHIVPFRPNITSGPFNSSRYGENLKGLSTAEHAILNESRNPTQQTSMKNVQPILNHEIFVGAHNQTRHFNELHWVTEPSDLSNEFNSSEEVRRNFKAQDYNEILAEKYINELRDLEQHVNAVHAKVNKTYERFSRLWDRLGFSICK